MSDLSNIRIALIHDELTRRGGAEILFEEIVRIFPYADIFTLYSGTPKMIVNGREYKVKTSFLQKSPLWFRRHPSRLLPLLPYAAEQLDFSKYDVVLSSSSGFAKAIITRSHIPHICYCHTPTRYLWEKISRKIPFGLHTLGKILLHQLRLVDYAAAQRVDYFIANSRWTRERIASYYRRKSVVIEPPINTAFFTPGNDAKKNAPFLCVGRLTSSKMFEQAIEVCEKMHTPLVIVGEGEEKKRLQKVAGKNTTFIGRVDEVHLRNLYREAKGLIQPGIEDFGMAAAESLACGTPVIAFGIGGAKEMITHLETGILYNQQTTEALAEGLRQFLENQDRFDSKRIQLSVANFGIAIFKQKIKLLVEKVIANNDQTPV